MASRSSRLFSGAHAVNICGWFGGGVSERENDAVEGVHHTYNFLRDHCPTHGLTTRIIKERQCFV